LSFHSGWQPGFSRLGSLAIIGLLACASSAAAQDVVPRRPYQGLFAGQPNPNRQFNVQWSTLGVYDDNVTADTANYDPHYQSGGTYGLLATGLTFMTRSHGGSTFTTDVRSTARYFTDLRQFNVVDAAAAIGYQTTLGRTVKVAMNQGFGYQPFYQLDFMAAALPVIAPPTDGVEAPPRSPDSRDVPLTPLDSYQYNGGASVSKSVGRHSTFGSDFSYRLTKFANSAQPFFWRQLGAHYSHSLNEHLALRLGYAYGLAQDSVRVDLPATVNQNIDLGADYGRAISRSRRTHLSFSSGSSIVTYLGKQYFVVIGNAEVRRELGQTWNASISYNRGIQFVEGLTGPLKADSFQTKLTGLLSHRFDVSAIAGYSRGQLGVGSTDPGYDTIQTGASLRYALARTLSFQAEYRYYTYDFAESARLPLGVAQSTNRNSVRIGLTGWLPFMGR
jgi:opacity protein-like surface antigen